MDRLRAAQLSKLQTKPSRNGCAPLPADSAQSQIPPSGPPRANHPPVSRASARQATTTTAKDQSHSKSAIPAADFLQFALDFRDPSITCSKAPSRAMSPSLIVNQFCPASCAGDDNRLPDMSSEKTPVHFCGARDADRDLLSVVSCRSVPRRCRRDEYRVRAIKIGEQALQVLDLW